MHKHQKFLHVIFYIILVPLVLIILFPIIYTIIYSFSDSQYVLSQYNLLKENININFDIFPKSFSLQSYYEVFLAMPNYLIKFWTSLFLCIFIIIGQIIVSCLGGFAFSKYNFKYKNIFMFLLVIFMLIPIQVTLLPNFIVLNKLNLINTHFSLILPAVFYPLGTVLMTIVFKSIPNELIEYAKLDGANSIKILVFILMPIAKSGIISLVILTFVDNWNMVEQPMVFISDIYKYPLSVFLASTLEKNIPLQFVCGVLCLIPVSLLFLFYVDELIEGITFSGIK